MLSFWTLRARLLEKLAKLKLLLLFNKLVLYSKKLREKYSLQLTPVKNCLKLGNSVLMRNFPELEPLHPLLKLSSSRENPRKYSKSVIELFLLDNFNVERH